jgi:hypothetical protein
MRHPLVLLLAWLLTACATVTPSTHRVIVDQLTVGESLGAPTVTAMHGILRLEVTTPDGQVHQRVALNAWPDAGEAYIVNAWRGLVPLSDARYHALGTSTAAFAEGQTQCQAELTNQYLVDNVRATGTLAQGATPSTFRTVGVNTIDRSGVVLGEFCLMTNPAVGLGSMITRILIVPGIAAPNGTVVTTTYEVVFE